MNERIKELAIKAGLLSADYNGFDSNRLTKSEEKFAELIVKECISICIEKERPNLYGVREVESTIKQHFGVEE